MSFSDCSKTPIDMEYLHQISEGDTEFELELLQVFIADTAAHIMTAKAAASGEDFQALEREAHHIKGASGNVGATAMQALATALEQEAQQASIVQVSELIAGLEHYLGQVSTYVSSLSR